MADLEQESLDALRDILQDEYDGGHVHATRNGDEYIFDCPACGGDVRGPCFHFNLAKGIGHCFRDSCSWTGDYRKFLSEFFQWSDDHIEERLKLRPETDANMLIRRLKRGKKEDEVIITKHQEQTFLQGSVQITKENVHLYPDFLDMLARRRYEPRSFLDKHDVYWPPQHGQSRNRVVFLIRTKANYTYLAYALSSSEKIKTINAPESMMLEFLYNYNDAIDADTIFVVEGIFDCARVLTYNGLLSDGKVSSVSLLGTRMGEGESETRAFLLRDTKAKEIVICLDKDAIKSSWAIYHYLKKIIPDKDISVMNLADGTAKYKDADPDDMPFEDFKKAYEKRYIRRSRDSVLQAFRRSVRKD